MGIYNSDRIRWAVDTIHSESEMRCSQITEQSKQHEMVKSRNQI